MLSQDTAVIMVIDSDPVALTSVAASLQAMGYECHTSSSANAAVQIADNLELDLLICEASVGDECGLELCDRLRNRHFNNDVPAIFVSEKPIRDLDRRKQDPRGFYYLRKPLDPDVLIDLVEKALWMPHLVKTRVNHTSSSINRSHIPSAARRQRSRNGTLGQ